MVPANAYPAADLEFSISLDKMDFQKNDKIDIAFTLTNNGKHPVMVNRRFYLAAPALPERERDVYMEVVGPSGEPLDCRYLYGAGYPRTDHFYELAPGESVQSERKRSLKSYYEMEETGTYKITAYYRNAFGDEIGLDVFTKQIASEPVELTLTE